MPLFLDWFNGDASTSGGFTRRRLIRNPVIFRSVVPMLGYVTTSVNKSFIHLIIPVDRRAVDILLIIDFYYYKGNTLNDILVPHL